MGYILPITQYDSIHYQRRMNVSSEKPFYINPLQKTKLDLEQSNKNFKENSFEQLVNEKLKQTNNKEQTANHPTGKGTFINIRT